MKKFYLKVKKLNPDGKILLPSYENDAGYDCCATESKYLEPHETYTMGLGLSIDFPKGWVCQVNQKSGLAKKFGLDTIGGIIDCGYHGEIHVTLTNTSNKGVLIEKGQKVCQLIFIPCGITKDIICVDSFEKTDREDKGFGSSGK